jgi:hypothetical protein
MTEPELEWRIISMDPAEEVYAVFIGPRGGSEATTAWEERALHFCSYEERKTIVVNGLKYRTKWDLGYSSVSHLQGGAVPNELRASFVGNRPAAMPRDEFAVAAGLTQFDRALYLKAVTAMWSLGAPLEP